MNTAKIAPDFYLFEITGIGEVIEMEMKEFVTNG